MRGHFFDPTAGPALLGALEATSTFQLALAVTVRALKLITIPMRTDAARAFALAARGDVISFATRT